MRTSEDKFNEALRDVLKRKFDDYEEQPKPGALDRIRTRVKPARTFRYWWFSGALVLITISGLLLTRHFDGEHLAAGEAKNTVGADVAVAKVPSVDAEPSGKKSSTQPVNEEISGTNGNAAEANAGVTAVAARRNAQGAAVVLNRMKVSKEKGVFATGLRDSPEAESRQLHAVSHTTVSRWNGNRRANGVQQALLPDETDYVTAHLPGTIAAETATHADSAMTEMPLEELDAIALKEAPVPLHMRGVVAPRFKPVKRIVTNPAKVAWLVNASVLHSYQILTVPSFAATDFQNFNFPTLFTSRSIGYKFSAGVERRGIQLQLHYSGFRQTYSYEIANNNYLVKPDDKGQYHTVRQGDRMEENRRFSMLGLGISRQLRWGHSPVSRFYAALGAEYSHDLNSSQSLAWVNLGLGKQFAVSRHTAFSIGPYAEFSPVKVKGIANPFYYQPYRVGISAGLRFVRP
ncbi:hypothetical protein GCM10010967_29740 [Dyadobacter beijingensis]|uniref:Outer membrane protein beta-barrel domain-containing protein n=1 Tax=Dyadobacter beijingensis TaxID=365489 RepID=A0ABQ2I1I2_9BACT|nr:hypothetical protein [Dyadobacter beijingensis]GGM94509.1 hypothetical protein GCM10010967_29740 [Dyadobacter beijingensis]